MLDSRSPDGRAVLGGGRGPVASPVFKTVRASVIPAPVGSTPMRPRHQNTASDGAKRRLVACFASSRLAPVDPVDSQARSQGDVEARGSGHLAWEHLILPRRAPRRSTLPSPINAVETSLRCRLKLRHL